MSPWVTSLKTQPLPGPPVPLALQEAPWKDPPAVPYSVLSNLVVVRERIAPGLARLLIDQRLDGRHGRRGDRSSAES